MHSTVVSFPSRTVLQAGLALTLVLLLLPILRPSTARAQGFAVYEQGTCAMGRGGATVAQTCEDGSAIFFNPAGLVGRTGYTVSAGVTVIDARGGFTDDRTQTTVELQNDPIPVPHGYLRYGKTERLAFGLGMYVPYGLGTKWPIEGFAGRFLGYDNSLQSIYVQPTVAYQLTESVRAGAGLTVVFASVELNRRLDLSEQIVPSPPAPAPGITFGQLGIPPGTAFADASLSGSGIGFGANFGVQYEATDWITFGVRFLTPVTIQYEGEATFDKVPTGIILPPGNPFAPDADGDGESEAVPLDRVIAPVFQVGPLVTQSVETEITMPAQFVAGVSLRPTPRLTLLADYQWSGWSVFDRLVLDFEVLPNQVQIENYSDTNGLRLGVEYDVTSAFTLRGGFITHGAAAPDETVTPLLPEAYRNEYSVGLGWAITPSIVLNAAYQYIDQADRRGRVRELDEDLPLAAVNSGVYSFSAHALGATLTVHF